MTTSDEHDRRLRLLNALRRADETCQLYVERKLQWEEELREKIRQRQQEADRKQRNAPQESEGVEDPDLRAGTTEVRGAEQEEG